MADFPGSVINFERQVDTVSTIDAADVNLIYDEVEAIETFLIGSVGSQSVTQVVASVNLTGQGADITQMELDNTDAVGLYRISMYLVTTTADAAAGAVLASITWTDLAQEQTLVNSANLTILGDVGEDLSMVLHSDGGAITYTVSHSGSYGTAQYALYIAIERLL
jgi:hypothetical protein